MILQEAKQVLLDMLGEDSREDEAISIAARCIEIVEGVEGG